MYVTTRSSMREPVKLSRNSGTLAHTCAFGLAICIIVLALIESGLIIISRFWWAFIAVGFELITGFFLLAASLSSKYQVYFPFFLFCFLSILANIAFMIYGFILGANQLHFDRASSTFEQVDWTSERIQGIFNIGLSFLDLLEIFILCISCVAAFADMKRLKSQSIRKLRPHIATFSRRPSIVGGRDPRVIEDVEIVEEHCERNIDHPFY